MDGGAGGCDPFTGSGRYVPEGEAFEIKAGRVSGQHPNFIFGIPEPSNCYGR